MCTWERCACSLLVCTLTLFGGQADQVTGAEKQKTAAPAQKADSTADLMGGPHFDAATVERGRKIFVPTCGFCHGNDAHGKSGPDLVRSAMVLHDQAGETLEPMVHDGRPDRGMPAFPSLTSAQVADIATFLHSRAAAVTNRFAYEIGNVITGDPGKGAAYFKGEGHCEGCHSATGDLAHVATKYEAVELQRRLLYPAPNLIDLYLGKAVKMPAPAKVTVRLASGEQVAGTLDHLDEFTVSLHDAAGWYRSFSRANVTVDVKDPRAAHEALLPNYTDEQMHNVLAYLETLK